MNGPKRFASPQEEIIHGLASLVLGPSSLFCPNDYGHAKEPADIAWVENKCAILMYLTESTGSFEKKKKHNSSQLQGWLKKWSNSQTLAGSSPAGEISFAFSDIEHVVGLSVIDGGEVWCQYHPEQVAYGASRKLSGFATITGKVIRLFAELGCSARDIIKWVSWLQTFGGPVEELHLLKVINSERNAVNRHNFEKFGAAFGNLEGMHRFGATAMLALDWLKNHRTDQKITSIGADLRSSDVLWMSAACAATEIQMAAPGTYGPIASKVSRTSGVYTLQCSTFAHTGIALKRLSSHNFEGPGVTLLSNLDFGVDYPSRTIVISPRDTPSMLEREITTIRQQTLR